MQDVSHLPGLVTGFAFVLAAVFGAVATRVNFCTMGAISDVVNFGDARRLRMWLLAIAVAIAGAAALQATGLVDLSKTLYTGSRIGWLSLAVGGFLFGFGMTLGSGCGSKTLIRVGGGNLKSLIVLVFFAISAYMTLKGLFAVWRTAGLDPWRFDVAAFGAQTSDLPSILAALGVGGAVRLWFPFAFAAAIAAWVFSNREFRATREMIIGGILIGAVIVGGWYVSGHVGYLAEDPATLEEKFVATNSGRAESFSYTAPIAYLLELLIYWTDQSRVLTFGIAGVLGMLVGAAGMALATKTFRWEGFTTTEDLANHVVGGILMGFGGVTALGCTIGQGLSGVSTLALGSFLAVGAIVAGCVAALKYQMWRLDRAG
ncbi:MAG: YeeE/YedE family protein [Betaproteobacteria bacterium]|nr:YeeE/YedE family protein [Betaproteobacteria bacterium]